MCVCVCVCVRVFVYVCMFVGGWVGGCLLVYMHGVHILHLMNTATCSDQ